MSKDLQALWQEQPVEPTQFSTEEIRAKARRFQRTIRFRNLREYVAAVLVLVVFGGYAWKANGSLSRTGPALVIVGTLYVMFQLYTRSVTTDLAEMCVDYYRRDIERQRDLLRSVWRWYLGPLVPGMLVLFIEPIRATWTRGGLALVVSVGAAVFAVLVFLGVWWLNVVASRKLQRELDGLGAEPTRDSLR